MAILPDVLNNTLKNSHYPSDFPDIYLLKEAFRCFLKLVSWQQIQS